MVNETELFYLVILILLTLPTVHLILNTTGPRRHGNLTVDLRTEKERLRSGNMCTGISDYYRCKNSTSNFLFLHTDQHASWDPGRVSNTCKLGEQWYAHL